MAEAPTQGKQRQLREVRLVSDFLATAYPKDPHRVNVRVGAIHPEFDQANLRAEQLRALGQFRRRADGIVIRDQEIVLVEGYILPHLGKVSQILIYKDLIPLTPELSPHANKVVTPIIVGPIEDPIITVFARRNGVEFRLFTPDWVMPFIQSLEARRRRPSGTLPN